MSTNMQTSSFHRIQNFSDIWFNFFFFFEFGSLETFFTTSCLKFSKKHRLCLSQFWFYHYKISLGNQNFETKTSLLKKSQTFGNLLPNILKVCFSMYLQNFRIPSIWKTPHTRLSKIWDLWPWGNVFYWHPIICHHVSLRVGMW